MFYALSVVKMVSVHRLYKENVQTRRHKSSSLNFMSSFTIKFRYVKAQWDMKTRLVSGPLKAGTYIWDANSTQRETQWSSPIWNWRMDAEVGRRQQWKWVMSLIEINYPIITVLAGYTGAVWSNASAVLRSSTFGSRIQFVLFWRNSAKRGSIKRRTVSVKAWHKSGDCLSVFLSPWQVSVGRSNDDLTAETQARLS